MSRGYGVDHAPSRALRSPADRGSGAGNDPLAPATSAYGAEAGTPAAPADRARRGARVPAGEAHPVAVGLRMAAELEELEARQMGEAHPVAVELRRAGMVAEALAAVEARGDPSAFIELCSFSDLLVPCWLAWRRAAGVRRRLADARVPAVLAAWRIWARKARETRPVATAASLGDALASRHRMRRLLLTWKEEALRQKRADMREDAADELLAAARRKRAGKVGVEADAADEADSEEALAESIRLQAAELRKKKALEKREEALAEAARQQAEYEAAQLIQAHMRRKLQQKRFEFLRVDPFERVRRATKTLLQGNDAFRKLRAAAHAVMGQTSQAEERSRRIEVANAEALRHLREARARLVHVEAMHDGAAHSFARQVGAMEVHDSWYGSSRGAGLAARPPLAQLDAGRNAGRVADL